jgi:hypothetical protein
MDSTVGAKLTKCACVQYRSLQERGGVCGEGSGVAGRPGLVGYGGPGQVGSGGPGLVEYSGPGRHHTHWQALLPVPLCVAALPALCKEEPWYGYITITCFKK